MTLDAGRLSTVTNGNGERLEKASGHSRRLLTLLVGLLTAVALILSGAAPAAAQTRVGAQPEQLILAVGAQAVAAPEGTGANALPIRQLASATGVAAETGDGAAVDVGHAGIHQFPGVTAGKSQFFDGENLGGLSNTDGAAGVLQKNGNTRFVMRGSQDVGVDRTTGLPTNAYTVIRKPDGSVLTMFPGTSPMS